MEPKRGLNGWSALFLTLIFTFVQTQAQKTTKGLSPEAVGYPEWGFSFSVPRGWSTESNPDGAILSHKKIAGQILIIPHTAVNLPGVEDQMKLGLEEDGTVLYLTGELRALGNNSYEGEYSGMHDFQTVRALVIGTCSPKGGGAYILAVATPDEFSDALARAVKEIAVMVRYDVKEKELQAGKRDTTQGVESTTMMQWVAGTFYSFSGAGAATGGTERRLILCANGQFRMTSESEYSGEAGTDNAWGVAGQSGTSGAWTIEGDQNEFRIRLTYSDGSLSMLYYQAGSMEKGCMSMDGDIMLCFEKSAECQ